MRYSLSGGLLTLSLVGAVSGTPLLPRFSNSTGPGVTCNGTFSRISAQTWVDNMNPGWNLGNTLDGIPDEGDWGNPPVVPKTFDDVKKAGFKGVRLPGERRFAVSLQCQYPDYHSDMGIPF